MISTCKIKTTKGTHSKPYSEIMLNGGWFINELEPMQEKKTRRQIFKTTTYFDV